VIGPGRSDLEQGNLDPQIVAGKFGRKSLLRKRFRLPLGRGCEMNRGQKGPDQHYQQIDFHVTLRCAIAALASTMQKTFQPFNDSGGLKNG
jgi:hypothetical protein